MTNLIRNRALVFATLVFGLLSIEPTLSRADLYGGSLSYPSSLIAGGGWAPVTGAAGPSISWSVTPVSGGFRYCYELVVPGLFQSPAVSHFIVEVSENFGSNDFYNVIWDGGASSDIGLIEEPGPSSANPGMPSDGDWNDGLKMNSPVGYEDLTLTLQFDSPRMPVWGDFYAKGGSESYVYNVGLGWPDGDDGRHIAVPDTVVPVPGAVVLGSLGLGVASYRLRRKRA